MVDATADIIAHSKQEARETEVPEDSVPLYSKVKAFPETILRSPLL